MAEIVVQEAISPASLRPRQARDVPSIFQAQWHCCGRSDLSHSPLQPGRHRCCPRGSSSALSRVRWREIFPKHGSARHPHPPVGRSGAPQAHAASARGLPPRSKVLQRKRRGCLHPAQERRHDRRAVRVVRTCGMTHDDKTLLARLVDGRNDDPVGITRY